MQFDKGYIYHIYNQGNNRQKVFFNHDNYLFFLRKIKTHILPYADIFAWCLMPNHFHLMVHVNQIEVIIEGFAQSETLDNESAQSETLANESAQSETLAYTGKKRTLNQSIGIMLRSYTSAINKQNKTSGSLFRKETKAECLNCFNGITPSFYNTASGTIIHIDNPEKQYPQVCFDYIHQNPVKANLVDDETIWLYSSAQDYAGLRNGTLVNKKKASEFISF